MPKDEFDFDDPLELTGVALYTDEDTSRDMAECFIEEFLMLGYNHKQLLALFRNPHYLGMNMVLQNKGEAFVKEVISDVFARWGKKITWPKLPENDRKEAEEAKTLKSEDTCGAVPSFSSFELRQGGLKDPFGDPIPKLD